MVEPVQRFSNRVENYIKYRPGYPREVVDLLRRQGALSAGSTVADIGSGTGIFSALLLEAGCHVYGVEPNEAMRQAAERQFKGNEKFESIAAPAEATSLDDGTVDLVTCAQAFHWLDRFGAKAEFRRILRPCGSVALIWNERRTGSTPFLRGYEELLLLYGTDYTLVNHTRIGDDVIARFFEPNAVRKYSFANRQSFDFESLKGRLLSSSYAPAEDNSKHLPMLAALRRLFEENVQNGLVSFDYDTNLYLSGF